MVTAKSLTSQKNSEQLWATNSSSGRHSGCDCNYKQNSPADRFSHLSLSKHVIFNYLGHGRYQQSDFTTPGN